MLFVSASGAVRETRGKRPEAQNPLYEGEATGRSQKRRRRGKGKEKKRRRNDRKLKKDWRRL